MYEQLPSFPASFSVLVAHDLVVVCSSALDRTLGQLVRPFLAVGTGRGRTYRPDKLIRYTHVRTNVRCPRACTLILVVRRMQRNSIMRLMMIVLDVRGRSASVRFRSAPADACPHLDGQNRRDRPAASMHARAKERKPAAAPPHRPPTPEDTKWLGAATWWSEDGRLLQPSLLRLHAAALAIGSTVTGRHPRRARRRRNQVCGHALTGLPARLPVWCNHATTTETERGRGKLKEALAAGAPGLGEDTYLYRSQYACFALGSRRPGPASLTHEAKGFSLSLSPLWYVT